MPREVTGGPKARVLSGVIIAMPQGSDKLSLTPIDGDVEGGEHRHVLAPDGLVDAVRTKFGDKRRVTMTARWRHPHR